MRSKKNLIISGCIKHNNFTSPPTKNQLGISLFQIQTDMALSGVYDSLINVIAQDLPSSVYVYRFEFEGSIPTSKEKIVAQLDEPLKGISNLLFNALYDCR